MNRMRVRYLWVWLVVVGLASAGGLRSAAAQSGDVFLPFVGSRGEAQEPLEQEPDEQEPDDTNGDADETPAAFGPIGSQREPTFGPEAFSAATWTVQNNLGIGTETPTDRIDVRHSTNSTARLHINNSSVGSSASSNLYLQTGSGKGVVLAQHGPGFTTLWDGTSLANRARLRSDVNTTGMVLTTGGAAPLIFGTNDDERARINSNGNFGIGTIDPQTRLHVNGSVRAEDYIIAVDGILTDGSVGIGTKAPQSKLHVTNGDIRITDGSFIDDGVTIVPDYVFEPEYPLMSLDELRAYIAQEKHLPNVPSEEEIKAGGLDLSAFQMKLLEKVEELTLYSLAQDEQLAAQDEQIDTQNAQIALQQEQLVRQDEQLADLAARLAALEAASSGK